MFNKQNFEACSVEKVSIAKSISDNIEELLIDGELYKGNKTKIFAYIGYPENMDKSKKYPAVVLVHGGGGTALHQWVKLWNDRGYVAISHDTEGFIPIKKDGVGIAVGDDKIRKGFAGPQNSSFTDSLEPLQDQFLYHATSGAILCNTYLRTLSFVDSDKIGICGISWGGLITSIAIGYDNRYCFAVPIYGSLNLTNSYGNFASLLKQNPKGQIWDDEKKLDNIDMKVLWLNDTLDFHFTPDATTKCFDMTKNSELSIVYDFNHSHPAGWDRKEPYRFADSIVKNGVRLIKVLSQPEFNKTNLSLEIPFGVNVEKIRLFQAKESCPCSLTEWTQSDITNKIIKGQTIDFSILPTTKSFYVEIEDDQKCTVSSRMICKK